MCENYLAGRIPCACPEMDEAEEADDILRLGGQPAAAGATAATVAATAAAGGGRKRAKSGASPPAARCQVAGCEADISELKGYHRRHRVCLTCANASSVLIEGEDKRYCQQCGKFHLLADFDEGKRSCRRKLERHNKRRRRRPTDYNKTISGKETEAKEDNSAEFAEYDDDQTKDSFLGVSCGSDSRQSDKTTDGDMLLESEGHGSPFQDPGIRMGQSNHFVSSAVSNETHLEERIDNQKSTISSSVYENRSNYSTPCPTGRISFKLYDWNPAEFPRRLRHQIFQWLANMPVELEGYIRPGCTILTVFIAMPQMMWEKLCQNAALYLNDLVKEPHSLLYRRGNIHIYLDNMIYQVLRDGTSLMNIKMEVQVPQLHFVHPSVFEAGKPMEFLACGSYLHQPKFRILVSFAGKYLKNESCHAVSLGKRLSGGNQGKFESEHQIFKIRFPDTEQELFGPAFIEVENVSGLSNFIPVLFADRRTCLELERIENVSVYGTDISSKISDSDAHSDCCAAFMSRQSSISQLILDIGWLLKETQIDTDGAFFSPENLKRINNLLAFLIWRKSAHILRKVLHNLKKQRDALEVDISANGTQRAAWKLFEKTMNDAIGFCDNLLNDGIQDTSLCSFKGGVVQQIHTESLNKDLGVKTNDNKSRTLDSSNHASGGSSILTTSLIKRGCKSSNIGIRCRSDAWGHVSPLVNTRVLIVAMVGVVLCFGFCAALLHPHKAGEFVVSVRRCVGIPRM